MSSEIINIHVKIIYAYSIHPFFSPPNAITVLIDDSTSSAIAPALATALSLVALDVVVI